MLVSLAHIYTKRREEEGRESERDREKERKKERKR